MEDFMYGLFMALVVLLIGALFAAMLYGAVYNATAVEVETYTVGCEVSQMAYAEETTGRSSSRPSFKMGVRNDDFATTFDISAEQFAQFAVGDVVEVKVTVWEYMDGTLGQTYQLVGRHNG